MLLYKKNIHTVKLFKNTRLYIIQNNIHKIKLFKNARWYKQEIRKEKRLLLLNKKNIHTVKLLKNTTLARNYGKKKVIIIENNLYKIKLFNKYMIV